MTHKPSCDIYSNLGIPSVQKDKSYCTCVDGYLRDMPHKKINECPHNHSNSLPNQEPVERWQDEFRENVDYDEAELGCNWGMDELEAFISHQKALSRAEGAKEERERIAKVDELSQPWIEHFYEGDWHADDFPVTDFESDLIGELTTFLPRHMYYYDWNLPYAHMVVMILRNLLVGKKIITGESLSDTLSVVDEIKNKEGK